MNAVAIVCSRIESRRLPGKALMKIAGKPVIRHIADRIKGDFPYIVALPAGMAQLERYASAGVVAFEVGHDDSPLHRMAEVMRRFRLNETGTYPDWCIRITHDDALIDAQTVNELLAECEKQGAGYGCTPDIVEGAGVEVIHRDNLLAAAERRKEPTEFVSYFVRGEGLPRPGIVRMKPRASICRPYRLTLDYPEDALVLEAVLRAVGPDASVDAICEYLDANRSLLEVNRLPRLSAYTCAYNAEKWIGGCIRSASGLTEEHILVNDASTDGTLRNALRYFVGDSLHIITNEDNVGLASSSNKAVSACRGKYVMRLDADDFLDVPGFSGALPTLMDMMHSFHAVYPAYYLVDQDGVYIGRGDPRTHHHVGGAIFDKAFLNELRFREGLRNWDGLELYQRMVKAGARIGYYDVPTWCYRQHDKSMSKTNLEQREAEREVLLRRADR